MAPLSGVLYRYAMNTRLRIIRGTSVDKLLVWIEKDENPNKGEVVLIIGGHKTQDDELLADALHTLVLLQAEMPSKQVTALAAEIHGVKKNTLYKYAQEQQGG